MKLSNKKKIERIVSSFFSNLKAYIPRDVTTFAQEQRVLSAQESSLPGKFSPLPYQVEPMNIVNDKTTREINLLWGSQLGKGMVLENLILYYLLVEPSKVLYMWPTDSTAIRFGETKLNPMLASCKGLRNLIRIDKKTKDNRKLFKAMKNGASIRLFSAGSPAALSGESARVVIADEIDRYPLDVGGEGSPLFLLEKRTLNFSNSVKIRASTPVKENTSLIWKLYNNGSKKKWYIPCPSCKKDTTLEWSNFVLNKDSLIESYIKCNVCSAPISDDDRIKGIYNGYWYSPDVNNPNQSYHLSSLYRVTGLNKSYKNYYHYFADEYLKAENAGINGLNTFYNTFLALPTKDEEEGEKINPGEIKDRVKLIDLNNIPSDIKVITAGADVQQDRIEVSIVGHKLNEEMVILETAIVSSGPDESETWDELDDILEKTYRREDNIVLKIDRTFIDSGYRPERVLAYTQSRRNKGIYATRGSTKYDDPVLPRSASFNNKNKVPVWRVGTQAIKNIVFSDYYLKRIFFNETFCDKLYFSQFFSEVKKTIISRGESISIYDKKSQDSRNEALDTLVYAYAARHTIDLKYAARENESTREYVPLTSPTNKPPEANKTENKAERKYVPMSRRNPLMTDN